MSKVITTHSVQQNANLIMGHQESTIIVKILLVGAGVIVRDLRMRG